MNRSLILFINHPLAIGLILLTQTIIICLITGITLKTFWFSYVLFLIFLGGLLVLFIYVTSLASNEIFKLSKKFLIAFIIIFFPALIFILFSDKIDFLINFATPDSSPTSFIPTYRVENSLILNKLFNYPINIFSILLIIYLFLALVAAVKITNVFEGPLRPKF